MDAFLQDCRYGARMLRGSPVFIFVAVVTLTLGIGANTAMFSVLDALILRDLPVREPDQLVELFSRFPGEPRRNGFAWDYYEHYRDHNHVFSDLIGITPGRFEVRSGAAAAETITGEYVTGNFFPALGVQPVAGRLLNREDDRPGQAAVAVVSWQYWQRRFDLNPSAFSAPLVINGMPVTVVGVAPREFFGIRAGRRPDVWLPTAAAKSVPGAGLMGRLRPGITIEQAAAEMRVLDRVRVADLVKANTDTRWRDLQIELEPAASGLSQLRDQFANQVLILMGLVVLLLLMACTTIASMLLAKGAARRAELAIRVALGASRWRIVQQLAAEAVVLVLPGTVFGVALSYFGANTLVQSWRPDVRGGWGSQGVDLTVGPDLRVLLFTSIVAALTALLFVLPAAWQALNAAPASTLRGAHGYGRTGLRRMFGQSFVVAQVAVSMVLLSAASLFVAHLMNLRSVERLGFDRDSVLLVNLDLRNSGLPREQLAGFYDELLARLDANPAVRSSTISAVTPVQGPGMARFVRVEGFVERPEDRRYTAVHAVGPGYFETFGVPLLAGRDFGPDDRQRGGRVAIISAAMARYFFGTASPLGRHIMFDMVERETVAYEVVGVAGDAKYSELHEPMPRTMYIDAFEDQRVTVSQFALRTTRRPTAIVNDVRNAVRDVFKTVPIERIRTLANQVDAAMAPERTIATLSGTFGVMAALLAAIGLYGLLSYTVTRRANEIGIRMALGATRRDVIGLVLNSTLRLVCAGLIIGASAAVLSRPLAARLVVDLTTTAWLPVAVAGVMLLGVALFAAFGPAHRASRVDPMVALRTE